MFNVLTEVAKSSQTVLEFLNGNAGAVAAVSGFVVTAGLVLFGILFNNKK